MVVRGVLGLVLAATLVGACGDDADRPPDVISAGQLDIKLPEGWTVTEEGARRPATAAEREAPGEPVEDAAAPPATAPGDTLPLAEEDPSTAFFDAANQFRQCLDGLGTSFVGAPDPSDPDSPANDPSYVEDLSTCAAKSDIVTAMEDFNRAQDDLSPAEIEEQNEGFLRWRTCMIGRGWKIGEPKPDAEGRLFSIGGGSFPEIEAPPGKDLMTSGDLQACASEAQQ